MKEKASKELSAGTLIQHEIINILLRYPDKLIRLPSAAELAAKFNMSVRTVTRALKVMVDEGYIEGRQGVGMFSIPGKMFCLPENNFKIIGLLCGDGRLMILTASWWRQLSYTGMAVTPELSSYVRYITLTVGTEEGAYQELRLMNLDAVVVLDGALHVLRALKRLYDEGMPVMTVGHDQEGLPAARSSWDTAYEEMGRLFIQEKKFRMFGIDHDYVDSGLDQGLTSFFKRKKIPFSFTKVHQFSEMLDACREFQKSGKWPDILYFRDDFFYRFRNIFQGKIPPECLVLMQGREDQVPDDFYGILSIGDLEETGRLVIAAINDMLHGKKVMEVTCKPYFVKLIDKRKQSQDKGK